MTLKKFILFLFFTFTIIRSYSQSCSSQTIQNGNLSGAAAFCSDTGLTFCNSLLLDPSTAVASAPVGPDYDCLGSQPFPSWFFIKIDQPGQLALTISQFNTMGTPIDVDFIIWGPYTQAQVNDITSNNNTALLSPGSVRDCSFLPDAVEFLGPIPVVSDEYYVILITNFAGNPGTIEMESTNNPGDPGVGTTDCSIVAGELGADQEVCEGTTVILDGEPSIVTIPIAGYQWFLDTGAGFNEIIGETNPTLEINNNISGIYKVEVTDTDGNVGEDEVLITFYPQPTIETLPFTTYEQCDIDGTGLFEFDLQALFANDLMGTAQVAAGTFEVLFFTSQADADANTNAITTPYTNPTAFTIDEIFARVVNIASQNTCLAATTSFNILVNPNPILGNPSDFEICDTNDDGDDTNGFVNGFLLSSKDTEVLGSLNPSDYTVSYFDVDSNTIDKTIAYTNIANPQPILVTVTNNTSGCSTSSPAELFNLVVNPLPVVTNPVLLAICDDDQDGFITMDLTSMNPDISADFANETFQYYPSLNDAENNTNEITNPTNYINDSFTTDIVWVRTITTNGCFRISQINIEVSNTNLPASFQQVFNVCDDYLDIDGNDNANNDDRDGVSTFDFSSVTNDIIGLFPANQSFNISYYRTLADANSSTNAIIDPSNYRNIGFVNSQQIFVRIENPANSTCLYVGPHITLIVDPVPVSNPVTNIEVCDDDTDGDDTNGFVQSIDLESQTSTILGTQNSSDFTVTYHESRSEANSGTNPLSSPFTNTTVNQQTIYVRVTNNTSGCFVDRASFDVIINPLPTITANVELKQCDDDTDGFSDFNLNEAATDISTNFANETFVFYPTLNDAENDTNQITNPTTFTNRTVTTDIIWARAITLENCYRISEVTLTVSTTGLPASFQRTFNNCDDFLDIDGNNNSNNDDTDGISSFDFSSVTAEVRALFPISQQLTITYFRNQADALAEENTITDIANYRNIGYLNTQQIYIRVDSNLDNDCLGFGPFITLNVDPVPTADPVLDLELCDNADDGNFTNGFVQTFDIESQTATILGTQDPLDFTVTYHTAAADALAGANNITTTNAYTNTIAGLQTIFVRVTDNTTGCFTNHTSFDLIVNPLPIANFVEDLEVCDDATDGSAQNGFSQNIDLELQTAGILGTQDPAQFIVTYHTSLSDAQAGTNALTSPFTNTVQNQQIIHVRVFNSITQCANGISNFNVIINSEPTTDDVSDLLYCDDDLDGDDTNGFVQNIDLDSKIPLILGPLQDEDDFTVTFHETQADAIAGTGALSSPYTNTTQGRQTIFIRVVNDDTGCVNDNDTFDIVVNPLPDFTVTNPQIVCLNGPELVLSVENPAAAYDFEWTTPDGNTIIGSQITVSSGGLYTVTGTTIDGTNCSRTREIQVNESIIATLSDADITIVDDSDNNSITIDPTNLGIGDYEYALLDDQNNFEVNYQDAPLFENLGGGFYTILVRDKNGCGTATLAVSVIEFPKFFTPNNDGQNDTWTIKGANSTFYPTSQVSIFNRFGKLVAQINIDNPGWNGTYNGKTLPSDDYWYAIKLVDRNGVVRERKGNMSLLRRER